MRPVRLRDRIQSRLSAERARADLERLNRLTARGPLSVPRIAILGFTRHNDMLWASALTYTSSLSLVPILAVALSAVKGFGGVSVMKPLIARYLAIDSPEIAQQILNFVENMSARALGTVGGATLLVTVVLTLGTIEQALNSIFNVSRGRTWLRKFSDYLSVTFTVPLLVVAAIPVKTFLANAAPHLPGLGWVAATLPVWAGFSFLYLFFPNTRVRWMYALMGGLVAAIFLEIGQWGYIKFQVGAGRYQAIYGALASVPILLTWIYIAWIIVLGGAELTAAAQGIEPSFDLDYRTPNFVRVAALLTVFRAGERMVGRDAQPCSVRSLAAELGVAETVLSPVLDQLKRANIVVEYADGALGDRAGLLLGRDTSAISLAQVLECFDKAPADSRGDKRIAAVLETLNAAERERLGELTVRDLVSGHLNLEREVRQATSDQA
jgi:membrane protein